MEERQCGTKVVEARPENVLHLDCSSGLAGDMFLGACVDAGMPPEVVFEIPHRLGLTGISVSVEKVTRGGVSGTKLDVLRFGKLIESALDEAGPRRLLHTRGGPPLEESTGHRERSLATILQVIDDCDLPRRVRQRASSMFQRLGEVEAKIHGVQPETVQFHELGAADSMVDIVGAAAAIEYFAPQRVLCGVVVTGEGTISTDHGLLPVPGPVTAELLVGLTTSATGRAVSANSPARGQLGELVTPTGALILDHLSCQFGDLDAVSGFAVGWGVGRRELPDRANACRLTIGTV